MKKLIIFVVLLNCIDVNADVVKTKSFPLSMRVDLQISEPVVTSLYLKCNMIDYKKDVAKDIFASTKDPKH